MERLFAAREPLHDRVQPLRVRPLDFWEARLLLGDGPADRLLTAFGIAGGMPRYLVELAGAPDAVARQAELSTAPPRRRAPRHIITRPPSTASTCPVM